MLEQIECGIRNHLIVTTTNVPTEEIVKRACEIGGYTFIPVFSTKLVARYFDGSRFKESLQTKKVVNKKVVFYINDSHHCDISYADLLNLIISYQDEKVIFREKAYINRLCKIINHTQGNEKENTSRNKTSYEEIQTNIESQALESISKNIVLVINLNSLHTYYQWVSFYPNLEKLCSTRFINDSLKEKEPFEGSAVAKLTDQNEVISSGNFIEKSIKEF